MDSLLSSASIPITEGLCCSGNSDDINAITTVSTTINTATIVRNNNDNDKKNCNIDNIKKNEMNSKTIVTSTTTSKTINYDGMDKYERFECWLRENGGRFEMLALEEYSSTNNNNSDDTNNDDDNGHIESTLDYDSAEEKKETAITPMSDDNKNESARNNKGSNDEDSEMRGVHAQVTIPPNSICVSIPRKCLITVEMGQATDIGQSILHSDLELDAPKHIFLMIYLLWDRKMNGEHSFFTPYYDILPRTLHNMPIFWSEEDLSLLQGSYLITQIRDRKEAIEEDYAAICDVAPELSDIATLEEFKWARMCVCSRNFGLQMDGNRTSALVPHADMLNHHRPRETKWTFDEERQCFTITTLQLIPEGAQVFDSYGQKCNHRFLLNYGFAVEDNREVDGFCPNEVPIELGILQDDPCLEEKYEFWTIGEQSSLVSHLATHCTSGGDLGFDASKALTKRVRVCISNNENTRVLFSMLRVIVADENELSIIFNSTHAHHPFSTTSQCPTNTALTRTVLGFAVNPHSIPNVSTHSQATISNALHTSTAHSPSSLYRTCRDIRCPISFRNERASMKHLMDITASALASYPTTYAQDVQDLLNLHLYPRFSNARHAKIQVRGEKEVLLHFNTWAVIALEVMDIIEREIKSYYNSTIDDVSSSSSSCTATCEYDEKIHSMEEDSMIHHTILRYCADVLGSVRREERKRRKKNVNSRNIIHSPYGVSGSTTGHSSANSRFL